MKFILKVNNMFVKRISIDSYDGTAICSFSSNINDAMELSENEIFIVKPLIEDMLSIKIITLAKTKDGDQDVK